MPMYMDSPGYAVLARGATLKVLVPAGRISSRTDFSFDAVTAYMQVSAPADAHDTAPDAKSRPMLGVYEVFKVLSGNLSMPYTVTPEK